MQTPYTQQPFDAFVIAETSAAAVLSAIVLFRPLRPIVATVILLAAIWVAATAPQTVDLLNAFGTKLSATAPMTALRISAGLASVALLVARPRWIGAIALAGEVALWKLTSVITESTWELCALHLLWFGALLGVHQLVAQRATALRDRDRASPTPFEPDRFVKQDLILAGAAVVLASLVSIFVLSRSCDSADEWAYTYQAAVFAKLHAYAKAPPCFSAFQSFWVFTSEGRMFSQYTPGWPMFMAPFALLGVPWLAGPFSLGLFVVGLARLARRTVAGAFDGAPDVVAAAGPIAAVAAMISTTVLVNGASRFAHVFVCACFAWAIESLAEMASRPRVSSRSFVWGIVLGTATSWLLGTRPADGATLGIGLFLYFVYALVRRRLAWRTVAAMTLSFAFWGGLFLVILRLQLGRWFTTGYSLASQFHPWVKFGLSAPKASQLRYGIPLGTGAYCWWPLAPPVGLLGLVAALRGEGRRIAFMLVVGTLALLTFYSFVEFGRGWDFGYGPRYALPVVVATGAGTAVAIAPLWAGARRRQITEPALLVGGPALVVLLAAIFGVARLAPLLYPYTYDDVNAHKGVLLEARRARLQNALVWIEPGTTVADPLDLTENYPLDLYPSPDIVFAIDRGEDIKRCVREAYPNRREYRSRNGGGTLLTPE